MVVLHDLNMAAQYCDELVLLDQGRVAADGNADGHSRPPTHPGGVQGQGDRPPPGPAALRHARLVGTAGAVARRASRRRVHVVAGGGAASGLIEELVAARLHPHRGRGERL